MVQQQPIQDTFILHGLQSLYAKKALLRKFQKQKISNYMGAGSFYRRPSFTN